MSDIAGCYALSRIRPKVQSVLRRVNTLGRDKFTARALGIDIDASFPVENHRDLADEGFLGLCIPVEFGGMGFSMFEYAMVAAEIAPLRERQFRRAIAERAIYSQPISEGGQNWTSNPNQTQSRKVDGGWRINGFKKFASLAGYCDYYTIVCTKVFEGVDLLSQARLIIREAPRFPEIGRAHQAPGPDQVLRGVISFLQDRRTEGLLMQDPCGWKTGCRGGRYKPIPDLCRHLRGGGGRDHRKDRPPARRDRQRPCDRQYGPRLCPVDARSMPGRCPRR